MTSAAEPQPERRCQGRNKRGEACEATIVGLDGFCSAHREGTDMRELGRKGGQARAKKAAPQDRSERLRELAWKALEELLASDAAATAKVRAATELLDRLEPLLTRDEADIRKRMAAEYEAITVSARAKLDRLLASRMEAKRMTPTQFEEWLKGAAHALVELERVIVSDNPHQPIVRAAEPHPDPEQLLRGLVEIGVIAPPPEWKEFPEQLEARARQLSADAERRASEAEARLARQACLAGPEEVSPRPCS